jgi:hypothetical protein
MAMAGAATGRAFRICGEGGQFLMHLLAATLWTDRILLAHDEEFRTFMTGFTGIFV